MDRLRRLARPGLQDARAVHHRLDSRKQGQPILDGRHAVQIDPYRPDLREPASDAGRVAHGCDDGVAFGQKASRHMPSDEPRRPQEKDFHLRLHLL